MKYSDMLMLQACNSAHVDAIGQGFTAYDIMRGVGCGHATAQIRLRDFVKMGWLVSEQVSHRKNVLKTVYAMTEKGYTVLADYTSRPRLPNM